MQTNKTMKKINTNPVLLTTIFVLMLTIILMLATVVNAQDSDTNQLHACVNPESGLARFVGSDVECRSNEYPLAWNIVGPQGPPGDPFLYGQSCPEDTYMTGIAEDGFIICNNIPTGGGEDPPTNLCGNGILDPGEQCDDGNTQNGDSCAWDCTEEFLCDSGETSCFGAYCTDLNSDPSNCGVCGNPCGLEAACVTGNCVLAALQVFSVDPNPLPNRCGDIWISGMNFLSIASVQISGPSIPDAVIPVVTVLNDSQITATIDCENPLPSGTYNVCVSNGPVLMDCIQVDF